LQDQQTQVTQLGTAVGACAPVRTQTVSESGTAPPQQRKDNLEPFHSKPAGSNMTTLDNANPTVFKVKDISREATAEDVHDPIDALEVFGIILLVN